MYTALAADRSVQMHIVLNKFVLKPAKCAAFEALWRDRSAMLDGNPGFLGFKLLKTADEDAERIRYTTVSEWRSREDFETWTRSNSFKQAHKNLPKSTDLYIEPPEMERLDSVDLRGA